MKKYKQFRKNADENCQVIFKLSLDELISKINKNDEEIEFVNYYYKTSPVSMTNSTMNRICKRIEDEFNDVRIKIGSSEFNYGILKSSSDYSSEDYNSVKSIYDEYVKKTRDFSSKSNYDKTDKETKAQNRKMFLDRFQKKAFVVCPNIDVLTNIVLDICYDKNTVSKQFAWDICGDQILENLLTTNNREVRVPELDTFGDFEFNGENYKMSTYYLEG